MRVLLKSTKGISALSLFILLFVSGIVGAVFSYLWTVGYYVDIGFRVPQGITTITITNVTFPSEDANYFNVTVLNPTYSEGDASITSIAMISATNDVRLPKFVEPSIPYPLRKGEDITFKCNLNWGEYAGQNLTVAIFVEEGSGGIKSYETKFAKMEITEFAYNTTVTITQFNITVRNWSNFALDISEIRLGIDKIPSDYILVEGQNMTFPINVPENESRVLICNWPLWDAEANSGYLGVINIITVETLQGYNDIHTETFSNPVLLTLSNVTYPQANATRFILSNDPQSPHHVNLSNITISIGNETFKGITCNATGYVLENGFNVTILCEDERLNWDNWRGEQIVIRVYTSQGFLAKIEEFIPSE